MKLTKTQLKQIIKEEIKRTAEYVYDFQRLHKYDEGFLGLTTTKSKEQQLYRMADAASVLDQIQAAGASLNKDEAWETIDKLIKDFKASDAGKELYRAYERRVNADDILRRQYDEPHGPRGEMPRKYRRGSR